MTIALIILGFLALVVADPRRPRPHSAPARRDAKLPGDRTLPGISSRRWANPCASTFSPATAMSGRTSPRHAFMGVRLGEGSEQLHWIRIPGLPEPAGRDGDRRDS